MLWFIFFDILWLIICDIGICFTFEWLFVMQLLVISKFYIKNIYFFCFFILIKSNKQIDMTDPFNKWVGLGLKNLDLFNKHVGLVLTYVVEYSWLDTTRHDTNPTCEHKLWLIICDIEICFIFEWLFVMQLLVNSKFYIKNIYFFVFS